MMGGSAISWFSRVQQVNADASSESEDVVLPEMVNGLLSSSGER